MPDQNLTASWTPPLPDLTIKLIGGTSTNRGYHETTFEVVSRRELTPEDFVRLDDCNLLGMGQAYSVLLKHEAFIEDALPAMIDRRTGKTVEGMAPINWNGAPITTTHPYTYHRYTVRRICDSGD